MISSDFSSSFDNQQALVINTIYIKFKSGPTRNFNMLVIKPDEDH